MASPSKAYLRSVALLCLVALVAPYTLYKGLVIADPTENEALQPEVPTGGPHHVTSLVVTSPNLRILMPEKPSFNMTVV